MFKSSQLGWLQYKTVHNPVDNQLGGYFSRQPDWLLIEKAALIHHNNWPSQLYNHTTNLQKYIWNPECLEDFMQ